MKKSFKEVLLKKSTRSKTRAVAVRMPENLDEELEAIAKKSGKSKSQVIIEALRLALDVRE